VWRGHSCPRADTIRELKRNSTRRKARKLGQPDLVSGIIPTSMDRYDPAAEYLRMSERYRQMSDEELLVLVPQSSELMPFAQQALANEVRSRGLKVDVADKKPSTLSRFTPPPVLFEHESPKFRDSPSDDSPDPDLYAPDLYAEDRKLVDLCTVWSARDALKVQQILDVAGIPFFFGPEKATGVDEVTSNFANGVTVQIMRIGLPWARQPMQYYEPEDDPTPKGPVELEELPLRCPICHSEEVVFEGRTSEPGHAPDDPSQKFKWTCDSCGHQWEDDGVVKAE
jgi:DNA-directed RNA polymerase subunit M/transcription elongation factor TFIIS